MFARLYGAARLALMPGTIKRVANTPLFVLPDVARDTLAYLMDRHGIRAANGSAGLGSFASEDVPTPPTGNPALRTATNMRGARRDSGKKFHQDRGIAVIPVEGTLVHKYGTVDPSCGMTGYDGIEAKITDALLDPTIRGVLLDIDSPGGEVSGCFGLADFIRQARDQKPIWAMVDEMACSAAYALAASCSRVYMADTGSVGSVGVVMLHADFSKMLSEEGIKVTLIYSGDHKVDGNPYQPLPKDVQATLQAELDTLRDRFADTVAKGRGIAAQTVLDTQARVLMAPEAESIGFVDGVLPARIAVQTFLDDIGGVASAPRFDATKTATASRPAASPVPQQESTMDPKTPGAAAPGASAPAAEPKTEASAADVKARIKAITTHAEAKGRRALAEHLAYETDMSVESAVATLQASPKKEKASAESPLGAAMAAHAQPDVGSAAPPKGAQAAVIDTAAIYASRAKSMGQGI